MNLANLKKIKKEAKMYALDMVNGTSAEVYVEKCKNELEVNALKKSLKKKHYYSDLLWDNCMAPLDYLRKLDRINNYDNTVAYLTIPHLVDIQNKGLTVFVIKKNKNGKYAIEEAYIDKIYYRLYLGWKVILLTKNSYNKSAYRLSRSMGLRIFFDIDNAKNKMNELNGRIK